MSSETLPIDPIRFAEAIKDLPISTLHLKVLELRNSISHLDYSNEQLRPFAEGRETPLVITNNQQQPPPSGSAGEPDQDCIDAIKENELVVLRMDERIQLVRTEVERRGQSWDHFRSTEEIAQSTTTTTTTAATSPQVADANERGGRVTTNGTGGINGHSQRPVAGGGGGGSRRDPWSDGTFQTGVIRDGQVVMDGINNSSSLTSTPTATTPAPTSEPPSRQPGGSLTDEELRRRVEEQMRRLDDDDDDDDDGGGQGGGMHL